MTLDEAIAALAVASRALVRADKTHALAHEELARATVARDSARNALDNIIAEQLALYPH